MKHLAKYTFAAVFGLYFLLAGTGFNIMRYCCSRCETKGELAELAVPDGCCDKMRDVLTGCCTKTAAQSSPSDGEFVTKTNSYCFLMRLAVAVPAFDLQKLLSGEFTPECVALFPIADTFFDCGTLDLQPEKPAIPLKYPVFSGRHLLSLKSLLLI